MQESIKLAVDKAVDDAGTKGWEAIVLVMFMLGLISLSGFVVRWLVKSMDKRMEESTVRETRMANRLDNLELFTRTTLLQVINESSSLIGKVFDGMHYLGQQLSDRPCLLDMRHQMELARKADVAARRADATERRVNTVQRKADTAARAEDVESRRVDTEERRVDSEERKADRER